MVSGDTRLGLCYLGNYNGVVVNGPGSFWTNGALIVGNSGQWNRVIIEAGGAVHSTTGMIGQWSVASNNSVVVSGTGSTWTVPKLYVGAEGTGNSLVISNGGAVLSDGAYVSWRYKANSNSVVVTGPGSSWIDTGTLRLGQTGKYTRVTVENGAALSAAGIQVGVMGISGTTNCEVRVDGGRLLVTNGNGTAAMTMAGGHAMIVAAGEARVDTLTNQSATLRFDGGTSRVGAIVSTRGILSMNGGVLHVGSVADNRSFPPLQISLLMGTLSIGSTSAVRGAVTVGGGAGPAELVLEGEGGQHVFGSLNCSNHAVLRGVGSVTGPVAVATGATLAPGDSGFTFSSLSINGGTLRADLGAGGPGSRVTCHMFTMSLDSYLDVDASACFAPSGTVHVLMDCTNTVVTGSFRLPDETVLANGDKFTADGQEFSIHYDYDIASGTYGTGNDIVLQQLPEPGAAILVALGGLLAAGGRRILRRRAPPDGP
ncbi:MAG: hypothetical protein FJ221_07865 [Lentisphaerae bacterium]|nr:hypothetical protein [Lentisphaerota bacterium]